MGETLQKVDKIGGGNNVSDDWSFYDVKTAINQAYSLPSDFKAIAMFYTNGMDFGYHQEASRAEIDKIMSARVQNGKYLQYGYDGDGSIVCLQIIKSGNSYSYTAMKLNKTTDTWGDSSCSAYVFLK